MNFVICMLINKIFYIVLYNLINCRNANLEYFEKFANAKKSPLFIVNEIKFRYIYTWCNIKEESF